MRVQIPLSGANSIVGRAVVVHELADDMGKGDHSQPGTQGKTSKTTGNAGTCAQLGRGGRAATSDMRNAMLQGRAWRAVSLA